MPPVQLLASRNYSPNSVHFGDLCLHVNGLCFRMYERRIAVAAAAALEEAGATRIVEATVSRWTLEDSTFILTLFESCEPCPSFTTAGLEDSKHSFLRFSFFHAQRGTVIHNVRVVTMNFVHKSFVTTTYQNPYGASWNTQ